MRPYHVITHYVNREIDYGYCVAMMLTGYSRVEFDCFLIVDTGWIGDAKARPLYPRAERAELQFRILEKINGDEFDYSEWLTEDIHQSKPVLWGYIDSGHMEFDADHFYFPGKEHAQEYGKLFERVFDLAAELIGNFQKPGKI